MTARRVHPPAPASLVVAWAGFFLFLALLSGSCGTDGATGTATSRPAEPDTGAAPDATRDVAPPDTGPLDAVPPETGTGPPLPSPDRSCPGDPDCPDDGDGTLYAGAAALPITPTITETWRDTDGDAEFDGPLTNPDGPEPFQDTNGNGRFDAVWIAGYGNRRPAVGVHDDLWARALVLRQGGTTVALVSLDVVGYFYDQVRKVQSALDPALGVDLVLVSSSHTHEGPDTIGIWGPDEVTSGVDPTYMDLVHDRILAAITEAVGALEPAVVRLATGSAANHPIPEVAVTRGINNVVVDGRDPVVIDDTLNVMQVLDASRTRTIATVVNFGNHPEVTGSRNNYISSDFVHYLRVGVEEGVDLPGGVRRPGVGGLAIFLNGTVGGMMSPNGAHTINTVGEDTYEDTRTVTGVDDSHWRRAEGVGYVLAAEALRLLEEEAEEEAGPRIAFRTRELFLPVENWAYHAMFLVHVFYERELFHYDRRRPIGEDNLPDVLSQVVTLRVGSARFATVPGELFPEWALGYDASHTGPLQRLIDSDFNQEPAPPTPCERDADCAGVVLLPERSFGCGEDRCRCRDGICRHRDYNPPDLAAAPAGPYLRDLMDGRVNFILGLTQDEVGYLIPPYDFKLAEAGPYVEEAPGDHYEETNSLGIQAGPLVFEALRSLLSLP